MRRFTDHATGVSLPRNANDWLSRSPALAQLQHQAAQLAGWQQAIAGCLPPPVAAQVAVNGVRVDAGGTTISLLTGNGAAAARLRQQTPTILRALAQQGRPATALRIQVNPGATTTPPPARAKTAVMSAAGLAALQTLATALDDSPLKGALAQLLAHQR